MMLFDKNWKKLLISQNSTIKQCLIKLNKLGSQILFVCSKKNELKGTITDGDIRRGLINGFNLNTNILKVCNNKPFSVNKSINLEKFKKLISEYRIRNIPILNKKNVLIGAYSSEQNIDFRKIDNDIIIMAGGKGQRLRPITKKIPKPMVNVNGRPILEKLILNCKDAGFYNFYLSVNYLKNFIKGYFKNGLKLGIKINYVNEKKPLGTVGSISLIKKKILEKKRPIIVINGDIIANFDLNEILFFHNKNKNDLTIISSHFDFQNPYGVIRTNKNKLISIREKPIYSSEILAGIYVLDYRLVKLIPFNKPFDMTDLINLLLKKKKKIGNYKMDKYWHEVGNISQYNDVINFFN